MIQDEQKYEKEKKEGMFWKEKKINIYGVLSICQALLYIYYLI